MLWADAFVGYASYDGVHDWNDAEHVAHKFIQILKGEPANGYARLPTGGGNTVKITSANPDAAFRVWGQWASARAAEAHPGGAVLIPIPSSSCLAIGQDAKGRALAEAVARYSPGFDVLDALHWNRELLKASKGGPRDVPTLFENLRVLVDLPKRPAILIDDVVTGGGHAIACAQGLRRYGVAVAHVIAAAKTVKAPPAAGLFDIRAWDLEHDPFADW